MRAPGRSSMSAAAPASASPPSARTRMPGRVAPLVSPGTAPAPDRRIAAHRRIGRATAARRPQTSARNSRRRSSGASAIARSRNCKASSCRPSATGDAAEAKAGFSELRIDRDRASQQGFRAPPVGGRRLDAANHEAAGERGDLDVVLDARRPERLVEARFAKHHARIVRHHLPGASEMTLGVGEPPLADEVRADRAIPLRDDRIAPRSGGQRVEHVHREIPVQVPELEALDAAVEALDDHATLVSGARPLRRQLRHWWLDDERHRAEQRGIGVENGGAFLELLKVAPELRFLLSSLTGPKSRPTMRRRVSRARVLTGSSTSAST